MSQDYSEYLIAARAALRQAEDAANREDWLKMAHACETATLQIIRCEQYADGRLRDEKSPANGA